MTNSQGSLSQLSYVEETVLGQTPAPGFALTNLPYTTHTLDITKDRVEGDDILADRMQRVDRHGNVRAGGDIVAAFRELDYDPLLASALFSDWVNEAPGIASLRVGVTPKSFTFQDAALDIAQHRILRGLAVNTLAMTVAPNQLVRCTYSMVGTGGDQSPASIGTGANIPHSSDEPFDSFSGTISEAGTVLGLISSLELNITNSLAPTFAIGSKDAIGVEFGNAVVTGNLVAYYKDASLIRKFLDEVESSLTLNISNPSGSATYTVSLPRIKLNGASVPVQNPQSRFVTIPIVALKDAVENSPIVITRNLNP